MNEILEKLRGYSDMNELCKPFFEIYLDSANGTSVTKVDTVENQFRRKEVDVKRWLVVKLLQDLARLGCGQFKIGRRGQPSRLLWSVEARELATGLLQANLPTSLSATN